MADPKGYLVVPVAFRTDGSLHALELDNSDRLKVLVDSITGTVMVDGASGSLFRPVPNNTNKLNLSLPAGNSTQTVLTVPANQNWRMTFFSHRYVGTVASVTLISDVVIGADTMPFLSTPIVTSGTIYTIALNVLLPPGAVVQTRVFGATLNDDYNGVAYAERVY